MGSSLTRPSPTGPGADLTANDLQPKITAPAALTGRFMLTGAFLPV